MKLFPAKNDRRPLTRAKAWTCLLLNVAVCPGVGSLAARRWSGWPQLALALGGSIYAVVSFVQYFLAWLRLQQPPPEGGEYWHGVGMGFLMLGISWVWSLLTSLLVLRQTPRQPEGPPTPAPPRLNKPW